MKKLWVFGCSASDLYDTDSSIIHWASKEYTDWQVDIVNILFDKITNKSKNII